MGKLLQTESTLTDRYQTTIPEPICEALHIGNVHSINSALLDRARSLTSDVKIDLDAPLSEKDE